MGSRSKILLETALEICLIAHRGQFDKGGKPYWMHPFRVADKMKSLDEKIVALLHDVIEDSDFELEDLRRYYSAEIVEAIDAITKRKGESNIEYYERVKANPLALSVKFADISDNMSFARLGQLDEKTQNRLREKYKKAIEYLEK